MKNKQASWGVLPKLHLQADTFQALKNACGIALTVHTASGWRIYREPDGRDSLHILWYCTEKDDNKFISNIDDPEELAQMIWKWLEGDNRFDFCEKYDTDGDLEEGFEFINDQSGWSYSMFKVIPEYIIYGK